MTARGCSAAAPAVPRDRSQVREVRELMPIDGVTEVVLAAPAGDLSLITLFLQAHIVVKAVIVGLLLASVWTLGDHRRQDHPLCAGSAARWTASRRSSGPASRSRTSTARSPAARRQGMASVFVAAMREWKRSFEAGAALADRPPDAHRQGARRHHRPRDRNGSSGGSSSWPPSAPPAPFVGLFGTVWGIMTQLPGDRRVQEHRRSRSSRPASPRRCSPPRSACLPPFRR